MMVIGSLVSVFSRAPVYFSDTISTYPSTWPLLRCLEHFLCVYLPAHATVTWNSS